MHRWGIGASKALGGCVREAGLEGDGTCRCARADREVMPVVLRAASSYIFSCLDDACVEDREEEEEEEEEEDLHCC